MASHIDRSSLAGLATSRKLSSAERAHLDRCVACRRAAADLGVSEAAIGAAVARRAPARTVIAAASVAALLGATVVATPLRGAAFGFITMFQPRTTAALPLSMDDLRGLSSMPDLGAYATTRTLKSGASNDFTDFASASRAAGFAIRQPSAVPSGMNLKQYTVQGEDAALITFSNHTAPGRRQSAPLPPDIAGSTLQVDLGTRVIAMYTTSASASDQARIEHGLHQMGVPVSRPPTRPVFLRSFGTMHRTAVTTATGANDSYVIRNGHVTRLTSAEEPQQPTSPESPARRYRGQTPFFGSDGDLPLIVLQMPVPRVVSTGVSMQRLVSYMVDQPGVPPHVAAIFRSLGDLSSTLPIPIPIDKAYAQQVWVDGVQGTGVGDDTGIGAAIIWQKNGMLYAVAAAKPARDVLAIANSLR